MKQRLNGWMIQIGLWLARKGGWKEPTIGQIAEALGLSSEVIGSAALICAQVEDIKGVSGTYRQREAARAMMNRHPDIKERDINLAIELVIRWTS